MLKHGLFVGLITLDTIYLAPSPPTHNQKMVATDFTVAAGGPATNAAVTFGHLGNKATLLGALGCHPITSLIRADLQVYGTEIDDLTPDRSESPPVSSIVVTEATGDRAVISINASRNQPAPAQIPAKVWSQLKYVDIVLVDGHQMPVSIAIARRAKAMGIPVVLDGGSWKPNLEELLPLVDYAICSSNFYSPHCDRGDRVFTYLANLGILHIAVTNGAKPIQYRTHDRVGEIAVPQVKTVDTLGAGDILHGAFCDHIMRLDFVNALSAAASVAASSCQFFGTRRWTIG
ncbi:sugar kinase [Pseudanabaena sp. PCC 6802]|uniref:sugar kinase n=1 Tax=Pseudanabaena sp. PCC 6802 TaxID=118173 RepID=UPI000346C99E|nr:sugar kinase [Pseudanabaena sp. PCC 6802]